MNKLLYNKKADEHKKAEKQSSSIQSKTYAVLVLDQDVDESVCV